MGLGGRDFDAALLSMMADHADRTLRCESGSVRDSPRRMATLLKEASRVKETLSANTDLVSVIEGLCDDKDFRMPVSRAQAEELWSPLLARVVSPPIRAMNEANATAEELVAMEVVGGGIRIPSVQQQLLTHL